MVPIQNSIHDALSISPEQSQPLGIFAIVIFTYSLGTYFLNYLCTKYFVGCFKKSLETP